MWLHLHSAHRRMEIQYYCDFLDNEHQKLLSHKVTRWLSLYPSLPRMIQVYPALQSYFMSIDKPTGVLKCVFWNYLSEHCLRHLQSFVVVFNEQGQNIKNQKHQLLR